jgi:hypothetical protein
MLAVLHQVNQQVEHLRLDGNRLGPAAELPPFGIERVIGKEKLQIGAPNPIAKPLSRNNAHLKDKSSSGQSLSAPR